MTRVNPGYRVTAMCKEAGGVGGAADEAGCVDDFTESKHAPRPRRETHPSFLFAL